MSLRPQESSSLAVVGLVSVNAVPLVGVVFFGWSLSAILVIYWLESGLIGALNVPRILLAADPSSPKNFTATMNGRQLDLSGPSEPREGLHLYWENLPIAGFFLFHYGIFWVVHGVFVLVGMTPFIGSTLGVSDFTTVALGVLGMVVSHGGSFVVNYVGREEYRTVSPGVQMKEPYRRVVVLHVTIILGAFAVGFLGTPLGALVLLVVLKTGADLVAHLAEHRRATRRRARAERETEGRRITVETS